MCSSDLADRVGRDQEVFERLARDALLHQPQQVNRALAVARDDERLAAVPRKEDVESAVDILIGKVDRLDAVAFGVEERKQRCLPVAWREDLAALGEGAGLVAQGGIDATATSTSEKPSRSKPVVKVISRGLWRIARAAIAVESIPPDRKAPTVTSARMCLATESSSTEVISSYRLCSLPGREPS